jgi:general stress protein CsbA
VKLSKWMRNAKNDLSNQQTRQYIFFIAKNIYIMNQSIQHEKVEQPKEEKNDLVEVEENKENKESEEETPRCKTCSSSTLVTPKKIPFWAENPNILLQQPYVLEFFPTEDMTFDQKLNAITRLVLVLTTISYLYTKKINLIVVSVVSIVCIYLMFYANNDAKKNEGFRQNHPLERSYDRNGPIADIQPMFEETFEKATAQNPMSNVMISDYDYHPHKKPAPPAYTKEGKKVILEETKKMIQQMHPDHENIDKKLFQDTTDNLELEQSMRQFYSTANTTIPNDQASFAEFCYGDMISNKEGNMFAAVRNNPRHNLY